MNARLQATQEIEHAKRKAFFHTLFSQLWGKETHLIPFEWVRFLHPKSQYDLGTQTIAVEHIIGSVDRYEDFDQHFFPLSQHLDERWIAVRTAQLMGKELPPIEVYKVGEAYFVKDGNHRVSVAKRNHQHFIDAHVIELDVDITPSKGEDLKSLILRAEQAHFYHVSQLDVVRPRHEDIVFSTTGRYDILLNHIQTLQYFEGMRLQHEVSWQDAVCLWYDTLYAPLISHPEFIHSLGRFAGRTAADLYLWIMDHRYFLSESMGYDVGSEEALHQFATQFSPRWYQRLADFFTAFPLKPAKNKSIK